jgi:hypothetical protein
MSEVRPFHAMPEDVLASGGRPGHHREALADLRKHPEPSVGISRALDNRLDLRGRFTLD